MMRGVLVSLAISILIYLDFSENSATNKDTLLLYLDGNTIFLLFLW
jgi:hypothetical protein